MRSPVLFLVFNRPIPTAKVFEAIRAARPPRLYIAADGPRAHREGEAARCAEVRDIVTRVDWPCEIRTLFRNENLGCKAAVSGGISWFFEQEEEGVILEDDVVPSGDFFRFMEACLEMFREDETVGLISGFNPMPDIFGNGKPFIAKYPYIWGWATWRRVWSSYSIDIEYEYDDFFELFYSRLKHRRGVKILSAISEGVRKGEIDTWDLQLAVVLIENCLGTIYPPWSLTQNIGFDMDATHTRGRDGRSKITAGKDDLLSFDKTDVVQCDAFDVTRFENEYPALLRRIVNKIGRVLGV